MAADSFRLFVLMGSTLRVRTNPCKRNTKINGDSVGPVRPDSSGLQSDTAPLLAPSGLQSSGLWTDVRRSSGPSRVCNGRRGSKHGTSGYGLPGCYDRADSRSSSSFRPARKPQTRADRERGMVRVRIAAVLPVRTPLGALFPRGPGWCCGFSSFPRCGISCGRSAGARHRGNRCHAPALSRRALVLPLRGCPVGCLLALGDLVRLGGSVRRHSALLDWSLWLLAWLLFSSR
jgi:hypothetical protein